MARGLREPVVHFLLVGAAVLGVSSVWGSSADSRVVRVGSEQIEALGRGFELRRGRAPAPDEERALVERHIDEEILVREALSLGLDRGDVVIRRRLAQKMEFLTHDLYPPQEPSDDELERYLLLHAERYAEPARVTLSHVFAGRVGDRSALKAQRVRVALEAGTEPIPRGEPFIAGDSFNLRSEPELAAVFGPSFARRAMELGTGRWTPLESTYGLHIVRVARREPARAPQLAEIRERVRRDWLRDTAAEAEMRERARLRARYRIEIESAP